VDRPRLEQHPHEPTQHPPAAGRRGGDRPFLFVIHDVATGTPLFIGRVDDPTAT